MLTNEARLSLDYFWHAEKDVVGIGRAGEDLFAIERRNNLIGTQSSRVVFAVCAGFSNLKHGRDCAGIELVELIEVGEKGVEIAHHGGFLGAGQFEIGQLGDTIYILQRDCHGYADLEKSSPNHELERVETQLNAVS